jgi:serine phosphatase RsbU (regulator of sigma subunit)
LNPTPSGPRRTPKKKASSDAWGGAASLVGPEDLAALYEAGEILSRSLDLHQTEEAIVLAARHHFGFDRAGLWLYDPEGDCLHGSVGTDESLNLKREDHLVNRMDEIPAPIRSVIRGELPFYLTDNLQRDLPIHSTIENMTRVTDNAVVPLRRDEKVLGFLSVDNAVTQRPISEARVRILLLYANYAAAALHNAIIAEQTKTHLAETALRKQLEIKIRRLQEVHVVASEITSLDLEAILRLVRDRLVSTFGFDRAGILLYDPRDPDYLRGTWGTDWQGRAVDEHEVRFQISEDPPLSELISGERTYLLSHLSIVERTAQEVDPLEHAMIPLRSSKRLLGVLSVDNSLTGRAITEEDIEILLLMAGHVSLAIQKAHVFALEQDVNTRLRKVLGRESKIANTLQKAFKPTVGTRLYGARIAHLYRPAMAESDLGGDFYDVLDLGNELIGLIMADVSGKGLAAAARTARARYALQAFASEDSDPLTVLKRLNRFLHHQTGDTESYVTVFYGTLNTQTGELHCASAGHEPPLLLRKNDGPQLLNISGVPCGLFSDLNCESHRFRLEPGDRLLLYSDGVTEARQNNRFFEYEGLRQIVVEESSRLLDSLVRRIYARVLRYSGGVMRDDVALLMLELDPL